ncbi:MAG: hypothetical protein KAX15_05460 [Candidatus Omnitrophica bacterium]|nr:hypothetical protein [Candidatus Omnitrophota bacterium]
MGKSRSRLKARTKAILKTKKRKTNSVKNKAKAKNKEKNKQQSKATNSSGINLKKIIPNIIAILLIPIAVNLTMSLVKQISNINQLSEVQVYFLAGIVAYMAFDSILYRPMYLYVLGHELTHVLASWLCGAKVTSFKVSSQGGEAGSTKSNFFISLSPYFIPLYTLLLCLSFYLTQLFYEPIAEYQTQFIFLIGATWSFHLVLTAHFLKTKQPDFTKWGYLFSVVLVYIVNIIILSLPLAWIFDQVVLKQFFLTAFDTTKDFYLEVYRQLFL